MIGTIQLKKNKAKLQKLKMETDQKSSGKQKLKDLGLDDEKLTEGT